MELIKVNPTSPGRRAVVKVVDKTLYKGRPFEALISTKKPNPGRNCHGRITARHRGGGHKQLLRLVDFKRNKFDIPAKVERIEYDPNRSGNIALLCYADGERRYIIAPKGLKLGQILVNGPNSPIKFGNALPIKNIPVGAVIHCVEIIPGKGAQLARSAGTSIMLVAKEGSYAQIRLRSGEVRRSHIDCMATIGEVGNSMHNLRSLGKAGASRWRGIRPTVRGVVMNPIDHPHGGGEGRTGETRAPVSSWGSSMKGKKTRNNKRTDKMILSRRKRA